MPAFVGPNPYEYNCKPRPRPHRLPFSATLLGVPAAEASAIYLPRPRLRLAAAIHDSIDCGVIPFPPRRYSTGTGYLRHPEGLSHQTSPRSTVVPPFPLLRALIAPSFPNHPVVARSGARAPKATMSDDQVSLPYFLAILVIVGCIVRYLFFNGGSPAPPSSRSPEAIMRARELAVERIQQMFPQAERRSILWDLQRNGGNIQTTTERILAGRLETVRWMILRGTVLPLGDELLTRGVVFPPDDQPPITFQPPPPPNQRTTPGSTSASTATRQPEKPAQPDLITRYNLKDKLNEAPPSAEEQDRKGKGWSSNREERQMSLQQRREQMILAARRKMEAKLAAERAAES